MDKSDQVQNKKSFKENSEDSLLVIYVLNVLKKYSSPKNPLSSQDVLDHLKEDYSIGNSAKADAQRKKIRRYLDTLSEYYGSCIQKEEGETRRNANKWFYDISNDRFADKEVVLQETLTETEIEFLVDLISATKILNCEGTRGLIDKLLQKTSISKEDRARRLDKIQREGWSKTPNEDLAEKKDFIEECFHNGCLIFDYEDEEYITAIPLKWSYDDGVCFLEAKVGKKHRKFALDKIRNCDTAVDGYEEHKGFRAYDSGTDSDQTCLDSLFVNIPTIKSAIADKKCIRFLYRSYAVDNGRVVATDQEKSVLPHSLVFSDGKYYLIGIDEDAPELNKVAYFRVDLMFELYHSKTKIKLSDWNKLVFDRIERARLVERHPLMTAGKEVAVTFNVVESAIDRVIDAFAVTPDKFTVTDETKKVKDSSAEGFHEERVVSVKVNTTIDEAFRWSLANADVVELISPYDLRYKLRRIAAPLQRSYVKTIDDQVRENVDRICESGSFNLVRYTEELPIHNDGSFFSVPFHIGEELAYESYKVLRDEGKLDVVNNITIWHNDADRADYLGDFCNVIYLDISNSKCKNPKWISKLNILQGINISSTEIDNVSWLKDIKNLRGLNLEQSPISDLSALKDNENILQLKLIDIDVSDIAFIGNYQSLQYLTLIGCPIKDYSPLLSIPPLMRLEIDEKVVESLGLENIKKHHQNADIIVKQKIVNLND